jgi:hypothetical protein
MRPSDRQRGAARVLNRTFRRNNMTCSPNLPARIDRSAEEIPVAPDQQVNQLADNDHDGQSYDPASRLFGYSRRAGLPPQGRMGQVRTAFGLARRRGRQPPVRPLRRKSQKSYAEALNYFAGAEDLNVRRRKMKRWNRTKAPSAPARCRGSFFRGRDQPSISVILRIGRMLAPSMPGILPRRRHAARTAQQMHHIEFGYAE